MFRLHWLPLNVMNLNSKLKVNKSAFAGPGILLYDSGPICVATKKRRQWPQVALPAIFGHALTQGVVDRTIEHVLVRI
jgi:hypothetical protein